MTGRRWASVLQGALALLLLCAIGGFALAAPAPTGPHPAIWKIQNGSRTVYLFGSLHILPRPLVWNTPEIDAAMRASDVFVFEVPVDERALENEKAFILQYGLLPRGVSLSSALTPSEFQVYSAVLRRAGLKPEQYSRYRPWLASVVLGLSYLHPQEIASLKGADDLLLSYAQTNGREVRYFETVEQQMDLLSRTNDYAQLRALKHLIRNLPQMRTQENELFESWVAGDADRLAGLIMGYFEGYEMAQNAMIDSRNRSWLNHIREFLSSSDKTVMVTVGAAHIGGENGLVQLLCTEGFGVERMGPGGAKICDAKA